MSVIGGGSDEFVRFYRWELVLSRTFAYLAQVYRLADGENHVDFDSGKGDTIVKQTVWWSC